MSEDLYAVLGLERSASSQEIKRAYRELARRYHPDRNQGDAEAAARFRDVAEAYRVLGDAELRARYDQHRDSRPESRPQQTRGTEAAGDLFEEIFGTRSPRGAGAARRGAREPPSRRRREEPRGADLRYTLELDFVDAALGVEKEILVPRPERCDVCGGTGARPGTAPLICQQCGGRGTVVSQQGFFDVSSSCPKCQGAGKIIPQNCTVCSGQGTRSVGVPLSVKVPPGVDSGTRLKLQGEGQPGPSGGPRGDLYVVVNVLPHPLFQREDDDVVTEVPVSFAQAALGAQVEIATLEGKVLMRIPAGTQTGRVFRLKGKGIPALGGRARGDQRVKILVETPSELSEEQRRLFEALAALDVQPESPLVAEYRKRLRTYFGA